MEKELKRLQSLFGVVKPTVALFESEMEKLPLAESAVWRLLVFRLSFGYYARLPLRYKKFVCKYLKHDRLGYTAYLTRHTPLGGLRYRLVHPGLFLKMVHLLACEPENGKISYLHLASCLLLSFDLPNTLRTLAEKLRVCRHAPDELLQLLGKVEIWED